MGIGEDVFSPQSQSTFKLWADLELSDQDVDDTFTDEEGKDRHQTPLPVPGKHSHLSSDEEKSPSKKAKLDVSNLYGATLNTSAKGVGITGKGNGTTGKDDGTAGKGDEDPELKAHKHKKTKKNKKKRSKKNKKNTDEKDNEEDKKKPTGDDKVTPEKKKTPEKKTPGKTGHNPSGDEIQRRPRSPRRNQSGLCKSAEETNGRLIHLWRSGIVSAEPSPSTICPRAVTMMITPTIFGS